MKTKSLILAALLITGIVFQNCKKEEEVLPPSLPPQESMITDFSDFSGGNKSIQDTVATYANWGHSALNVAFWNIVLYTNLAVPVAAFQHSFQYTPIQEDDGSWTWSYDYNYFGFQYTANLNGMTVGNGVNWKMYISLAGFYSDFLWYEGYSNLGGTQGNWTLYKSPTDPTPYIGILWNRDVSAGTASIQYTNIVAGGQFEGGYIKYGKQNDFFDAYYQIYNVTNDNTTDIEWNLSSKEGHVKDMAKFGDDAWYCWSTDLSDIDCQ